MDGLIKTCTKCKLHKSVSDFRLKKSRGKYIVYPVCLSCESEQTNSQERKSYMKNYRKLEYVIQKTEAYRQTTEYKEQRRKSRIRNKATNKKYSSSPIQKEKSRQRSLKKHYSERGRIYRSEYLNKPEVKQRMAEQRKTEKWRNSMHLYKLRYRARKNQLPNNFTKSDWNRTLSYFNNSCAVCGFDFTSKIRYAAADHWVPLSKSGGTIPTNILPLCHGQGGCNNSKGNKNPEKWLAAKFGIESADKILDKIKNYFLCLNNTDTSVTV